MVRITITATAFEAFAATLIAALLLAGTASARAETLHGALGKAYGTHHLDRAPQPTRRHAPPRRKLQR